MGSSYDETHLNIINSAKRNFLERGFEGANLRKICREANVTTGAFYRHFKDKEGIFEELVSGTLKELKTIYYKGELEFYDKLKDKKLDEIWEIADNSLEPFINLIYDNYDSFKLLLMCANGTKYSNFLHEISIIETKHTIKHMNYLKNLGYHVENISDKEVHMLIQSYFSCVFETVMHDYKKEDAIQYSKTIVKFYNAGWKFIFGI